MEETTAVGEEGEDGGVGRKRGGGGRGESDGEAVEDGVVVVENGG